MTFLIETLNVARTIEKQRDAATSLHERRYFSDLLDTAVEDIICVKAMYKRGEQPE